MGNRRFVLVAVDYFTKWAEVEAEVLVNIRNVHVKKFVWIVCCHRQPKIKPIFLKIYVIVRVRIVPTESIYPSFMLREQGGGVEYNENNFKKKKKKTTKEQFKLKYRN